MDIGQRIRQARLEQGLSQRQLCGDTITRNMLSLIESGKARPGMDTLRYLAQQLQKPISWFLEEETVTSPNEPIMAACRRAYTAGQPLPTGYRPPDETFDPEYYLLQMHSCTDRAEQAIRDGKSIYARDLLQQADAAGEKTPYDTPAERLRRQYLQWQLDPKKPLPAALRSAADTLQLMQAQGALAQKEFRHCGEILDLIHTRDSRWYYLRGTVFYHLGEYALAAQHLHRAEADLPQECIAMLEVCYRELGDFQKAYAYATASRR